MAEIKQLFGSATTITITLASLADGSLRQAAERDNGIDLFNDVQIAGKVTTGTSPTVDTTIQVFLAYSVDDGTTYSGGASGSDAAFTAEEEQLHLLATIIVDATSDKTYEFAAQRSIVQAIGVVPEDWTIVVKNNTGAALNSTGSNHEIRYKGVKHQQV